jgi:hypothetical protein
LHLQRVGIRLTAVAPLRDLLGNTRRYVGAGGMGKLKGYLDSIATVAMILASGVLIWVALSQRRPSIPPTGYAQGDVFGSVEGLDFREVPSTAILFLQSTCKFCTDSMPFYRRLSEIPRRGRLVVMGTESRERLEAYLAAHQFKPDRVIVVTPQATKVRGTPTILVVDTNGVVVEAWGGQLDSARELAVFRKIAM